MSSNLFANDQETRLERATDQQSTPPRHLDLENSERTQRPDGRKEGAKEGATASFEAALAEDAPRVGHLESDASRVRLFLPRSAADAKRTLARAPFLTSTRRRTNVRKHGVSKTHIVYLVIPKMRVRKLSSLSKSTLCT